MSRLSFKYNWGELADMQGNELKATWGSLVIAYNDEIISEHVDGKSKSIKEHLNVSLYPIAEWIALNWWFLLYEPYTPGKYDAQEYALRHNLSFGREGYAVPDLSFQPTGEKIIVFWKEIQFIHAKIKFINSGEASIPFNILYDTLYEFVAGVVDRLDATGISGTLLQEEWTAINTLDQDQMDFCSTAASIGIDPFNADDQKKTDITIAYSKLPPQVVKDFFPSCRPEKILEDAQLTLDAIHQIKDNTTIVEEFARIRKKLETSSAFNFVPWKEGYEAARELRSLLGLNGQVLTTIQDIGRAFNVEKSLLEQTISHCKLPSTISGISGLNHNHTLRLVLGKHSRDSKFIKFAYSRALYEFLFSENSDIYLITRTHSENQKKNRAFAAEFLVPAEKLRQKITHTTVSEEHIDELANEFNVDSRVIRHQIENHDIAEIADSEF